MSNATCPHSGLASDWHPPPVALAPLAPPGPLRDGCDGAVLMPEGDDCRMPRVRPMLVDETVVG